MTNQSWKEVKRIFSEALECPDDQRSAFLDSVCDGDVRERVDALLAQHLRVGPALDARLAEAVNHALSPSQLSSLQQTDDHVGEQIAGRYRLRELIGRGGSGAVYRAEDALSGADVAVKLLWTPGDPWPAHVRREVAALRHLRLPGVVSLLDDGFEDGAAFLVMEFVQGTAFPGTGVESWSEISQRVAAFLEALGRVHWAGVVHRDLKPENVLVDAEGRITILDLGIAAGRAVVGGDMVLPLACTPDFAAPELLQGQEPSVRSDLYAVGVMLHACITGSVPHRDGPEESFFDRRIRDAAPRIESTDPALTQPLLDVIDSLLERDPQKRPESASEVLEKLHLKSVTELPRLGDSQVVDALCAELLDGRSAWISGGPGSGRSRLLDDLHSRLRNEKKSVLRLTAGAAPFSSIGPLFKDIEGLSSLSLDEMAAIALQRLGNQLSNETIVLCDDYDEFDRWSADVVERCQREGQLVRVTRDNLPEAIRLAPLRASDLRPLFSGPDRLFHLREDAAYELWRRTGGLPARVEAELGAWIRSGLARRETAQFIVERSAIDRLATSVPASIAGLPTRDNLPDRLAELVLILDLVGGQLDIDSLCRVSDRPRWRLEAELEELVSLRAARYETGQVHALATVAARQRDALGTRQLRKRISEVLPEGSEARLFHLIGGSELELVAKEAVAVAEQLNASGFVWRAWAVLLEGLAAVRDSNVEGVDKLMHASVQQALTLATKDALNRVLYELSRTRNYDQRASTLETIARAALWTVGCDGGRALDLLEQLDLAEMNELASLRRTIEGLASRYVSLERERNTIAGLLREARAGQEHSSKRSSLEQLGWLHYREAKFDRAATLHERAIALARTPHARLSLLINAASARMENHDLERAKELATQGLELAIQTRHTIQEVRAEWLLRTIAYRTGIPMKPDLELVEAVSNVGYPNFQGLVCLNEAAVAWRCNDLKLARTIALRAAEHWGGAGRAIGKTLADALALACGAELSKARREEILADAKLCPVPGMAVQALGLLGQSDEQLRPAAMQAATELASKIPQSTWSARREILSVNESLQAHKLQAHSNGEHRAATPMNRFDSLTSRDKH